MPKVTRAGHPLHPMLIVVPATLVPFSFFLNAVYRSTGEKACVNAAYYGMASAALGGLAAGAVGASDYLTIPSPSPVKRTANLHDLFNISVLALAGLNILGRQKNPHHEGDSLLLSFLGTPGVITSIWFGERRVYEQELRLTGASPIEGALRPNFRAIAARPAAFSTWRKSRSGPPLPINKWVEGYPIHRCVGSGCGAPVEMPRSVFISQRRKL